MASLTSEALELAIRQHGLITTEQLARCGVGRTTRTGLVRQRLLHHEFKSVFRLPGPRSSLERRCAVLCLAHPSVFVTGATGGRLRGLRRLPRVAPLTISSLHPLHLSHRGALHRRTTKLIPDDVEVRPDGLRVAEPHRLAFDLAATLDDRAFRSVIEQMLHEGLVTTSGLARVGQRLVHPTRPGSHRFMRTMAQRSGKALESDPEIAVADALLAAAYRWWPRPPGSISRTAAGHGSTCPFRTSGGASRSTYTPPTSVSKGRRPTNDATASATSSDGRSSASPRWTCSIWSTSPPNWPRSSPFGANRSPDRRRRVFRAPTSCTKHPTTPNTRLMGGGGSYSAG